MVAPCKRAVLVATTVISVFVSTSLALKGTECTQGVGKKCCGVDDKEPAPPVLQFTCSTPTWYTGDLKDVVQLGYKDRGQCCCCTGKGGTEYQPGDVGAYNDNQNPAFSVIQPPPSGPVTVKSQAIFIPARNDKDQTAVGWCQQQSSPPQFNAAADALKCSANSASCEGQNLFWCSASFRVDPPLSPTPPPPSPPVGTGSAGSPTPTTTTPSPTPTTGSASSPAPTSTAAGDPHLTGFQGSHLEFSGISGASFALISEPETAVNVLLDDFSMPEAATFIKAVGFVHGPSGATVTVSSALTSCMPGSNSNITPLLIEVNGAVVDLSQAIATVRNTTATFIKGVRAEYSTPSKDGRSLVVSAKHNDTAQLVRIETATWRLEVTRNAAACHLDLSATLLKLLDSTRCGGLLCESLGWPNANEGSEQGQLRGDEVDYMVDSLTATDFAHSHFGKDAAAAVNQRRFLRELAVPIQAQWGTHWAAMAWQ